MQADSIAVLLTILASLAFTVNAFLIRKATVIGEPLDAVIVTVGVSALIFLPLSIILHYPRFGLTAKSLFAFAGTGLLGTFAGRICYFSGIRRVGASRTVPISRSDLLVASLIALLILGESITMGHLAGIFILSVGVILVGYEIETGSTKSGGGISTGLLFPLGAMFLLGLSRPIAKVGLSGGTPVTVGLAIKFSVALVPLVGFFLWSKSSPFHPFKTEQRFFYIAAAFASSIGFGLLYSALDISRIVVVMPFFALTPLFVLL
ncbi:hypothetical protein AKJ57_06860 [candidate division MSBL1 archaeon SCGC-AAA259A05]|uniref:EamA domain-containing protein n=1 Tax=candidate division MSBL1 archaeon SCGC-AAA259A05 TaxID=1698259 RepID=A0A133U2T2_9EURY|nr:hypothetical protein AKJ57_06860 [candidate division MSBL1 archaeon SCGC-AAA259A05]